MNSENESCCLHEIILQKKFRPNPPEEDSDRNNSKNQGGDNKDNGLIQQTDLIKNLKFIKILKNNTTSKQICLECSFQNKPAILILEKNPFDEKLGEKIGKNFGNSLKNVQNLFRNDVYGSYLINLILQNNNEDDANDEEDPQQNLNKLFLSLIYPASEKDLEKYQDNSTKIILETPDLYKKFTWPYIEKQISNPNHLKWLINILDGKAELDRIIFKNDQFLLVKDMKWKCNNPDNQLTEIEKIDFYINAIVRQLDLHSLRDLSSKHLNLLKSIRDQGKEIIWKKFLIPMEEQRLFIHYLPSFYHLHIHFTHIKNEHHGFQCERAHLLSQVIENIQLMDDYYQKISIEFPLSNGSKLKFEE